MMNGLFVPYEGTFSKTGDNFKKYMGYYLVFSPPSKIDIFEAISEKKFEKSDYSDSTLRLCSSHIIFSQFIIQEMTIILSVFGVVLLFGKKR